MTDSKPQAQPPRSTFVTVVAWVFICLGAAFSLIAVLEGLATLVIPMKDIQEAMNSSQTALPGYSRFIVNHFLLYIAAYFVATFALFVTAIGLLKRKRWARPTMIVLLALGAIRNVVSVSLELLYFSPASIPAPPNASPEAAAAYQGMMNVMVYAFSAISIAIAGLLVWIAVRLLSAAIKAEFEPAAAPETGAQPAA